MRSHSFGADKPSSPELNNRVFADHRRPHQMARLGPYHERIDPRDGSDTWGLGSGNG